MAQPPNGTNTNGRIQNEITERDVHLERYKRGLLTRMLGLLARVEEDTAAILQRLGPDGGTTFQRGRAERLLREVQRRVDQYSAALNQDVLPELEELGRDEAAFGVKVLSTIPPVVLDVIAPSTANLMAAVTKRPFQGRLLKEWVSEHPAAVRLRMRRLIRQGVVEGQTVDQMVRALRGTRANSFRDGIMEINRRGAEAMVRTAVNHVVSAAREETYAANEELISGVRIVATLDSRTSDTCMGLDGKVFPLHKGPRPPFHTNCRTSTAPVLKSWDELDLPDLGKVPVGTRASMDGQVSAKQTYNTWLKTRSAAFQDEVLGPTKAALFRKGGLTLDKFIDSSGRAYTLKELRRRSPGAFTKAGV